ncbi:hypothetical protein B296_00051122 [Ensete ventricosum]|uniref:Uncharacterized protein n=1 Tax=Ensete ventricosum TaxID=4639 RepID=A0A426XF79_ENSVE|nr:hypothetical protein B296_00051122 [Ensete ventricosum]
MLSPRRCVFTTAALMLPRHCCCRFDNAIALPLPLPLLFPSSSFFFFLHFFLLPSFSLPPLFLHYPFHFSLFFFLAEPPVCTGVPCVDTPVQTGMYHSDKLPKRVRYPKRQPLVQYVLREF